MTDSIFFDFLSRLVASLFTATYTPQLCSKFSSIYNMLKKETRDVAANIDC